MQNSKTYYVSVEGSDGNSGLDVSKPFRTIQKASDIMTAGDTCIIMAGTYEETVTVSSAGQEGKPVTFMAHPGDRVVVAGTRKVAGKWEVYKDNIYKIPLDEQAEQVFVDGEMVVEARWPKMKISGLWDRRCWARVDPGSRFGKIICSGLTKTAINWTGAVAVLNVAHQFRTWTRTVSSYNAAEGSFEYPKDLDIGVTLAWYGESGEPWEDDFFYLMGKLEALSQPGEWFYDPNNRMLYLWAPDGQHLVKHTVEYKVRKYGFVIKNKNFVNLSGIHFFSCAIAVDESNNCIVNDCHFKYPSWSRFLPDTTIEDDMAYCYIRGCENTVKNSSFSWCATKGLDISGMANIVDNCVLHDLSWYGNNRDSPLRLAGTEGQPANKMNIIRNCTLFNCGNLALSFSGPGVIVEKNHVYYAGLCCKDVQLVGTSGPMTYGNIIRYNWVHGCRTNFIPFEAKKVGGLGIRGDDQTRGLVVHHNVVWDTGRDGIIVKGEWNHVYNNTVFDIGEENNPGNFINLHQEPEPHKPFRSQYPLLPRQNARTRVFNNIAYTITGHNDGTPYSIPENMENNCQNPDPGLIDIPHFDFRPRSVSAAVQHSQNLSGSMTYDDADCFVGAYGLEDEYWIPGCVEGLYVYPLSRFPDGCVVLRIRLLLPPVEDVDLSAEINGKPAGSFHIGMEHWYEVRELVLGNDMVGLAFSDAVLGRLVIDDISKIDAKRGNIVYFDRPMLPKENIPVRRKHHCIVAY